MYLYIHPGNSENSCIKPDCSRKSIQVVVVSPPPRSRESLEQAIPHISVLPYFDIKGVQSYCIAQDLIYRISRQTKSDRLTNPLLS